MRHVLFLLVLQFLVARFAFAQENPGTDSLTATVLPGSAYAYDTVQAIHQLFADRRQSAVYTVNVGMLTIGVGGVVIVPTLAFASLVGSLVGSKPDPGRMASFSLQLTSPGLLITSLGLFRRIRFNRKREEATALAYEQGQPLPPTISRLLKRKLSRSNRQYRGIQYN